MAFNKELVTNAKSYVSTSGGHEADPYSIFQTIKIWSGDNHIVKMLTGLASTLDVWVHEWKGNNHTRTLCSKAHFKMDCEICKIDNKFGNKCTPKYMRLCLGHDYSLLGKTWTPKQGPNEGVAQSIPMHGVLSIPNGEENCNWNTLDWANSNGYGWADSPRQDMLWKIEHIPEVGFQPPQVVPIDVLGGMPRNIDDQIFQWLQTATQEDIYAQLLATLNGVNWEMFFGQGYKAPPSGRQQVQSTAQNAKKGRPSAKDKQAQQQAAGSPIAMPGNPLAIPGQLALPFPAQQAPGQQQYQQPVPQFAQQAPQGQLPFNQPAPPQFAQQQVPQQPQMNQVQPQAQFPMQQAQQAPVQQQSLQQLPPPQQFPVQQQAQQQVPQFPPQQFQQQQQPAPNGQDLNAHLQETLQQANIPQQQPYQQGQQLPPELQGLYPGPQSLVAPFAGGQAQPQFPQQPQQPLPVQQQYPPQALSQTQLHQVQPGQYQQAQVNPGLPQVPTPQQLMDNNLASQAQLDALRAQAAASGLDLSQVPPGGRRTLSTT